MAKVNIICSKCHKRVSVETGGRSDAIQFRLLYYGKYSQSDFYFCDQNCLTDFILEDLKTENLNENNTIDVEEVKEWKPKLLI